MNKRKGRRQPRTSEIKSVMRAPRNLEVESNSTESAAEVEESSGLDPLDTATGHAADLAPGSGGVESAQRARTDEQVGDAEDDDLPHLRAVEQLDLGLSDAETVISFEATLDADDALAGDAAETVLPLPLDVDADETEVFLSGLIEALLFTSQKPLPLKDLARSAGIDRQRAAELLKRLIESYEPRGLSIEEVAGGFVMRSSARYAPYIQKLLALRPIRLSRAQLETLAIIAYRQPVTKPEVDDIRGVDSGQVIKGLLERSLLKILGKKDEPGRPMLYGTTNDFLELLNLQSLKDLPTLREYTELSEESQRKFLEETGEAAPDRPSMFAASATVDGDGDAPAAATPTDDRASGEEAPSQDLDESESKRDAREEADTPYHSEDATDDDATDDDATDDDATDDDDDDEATDDDDDDEATDEDATDDDDDDDDDAR